LFKRLDPHSNPAGRQIRQGGLIARTIPRRGWNRLWLRLVTEVERYLGQFAVHTRFRGSKIEPKDGAGPPFKPKDTDD
jgi:hypothetical protein